MAKLDFSKIPKYSQLPIKPGAPAHSNWGVFGDDDEVGCFNFLTPEGIIEAAKLIRNGKAFRLDNRIGYAEPPIGGRGGLGVGVFCAGTNSPVLSMSVAFFFPLSATGATMLRCQH